MAIVNRSTNSKNKFKRKSKKDLIPVRVLDIILDESHPNFKEYGGYDSIGTIIYSKIEKNMSLSVTEHEDVLRLPTNYLICYLNGYLDAPEQLRKAKEYIKSDTNKTTYLKYKEAMRVLRKVKYN